MRSSSRITGDVCDGGSFMPRLRRLASAAIAAVALALGAVPAATLPDARAESGPTLDYHDGWGWEVGLSSTIDIDGTGLTGATAVTVDGLALAFSVVSDTRIRITTPDALTGTTDSVNGKVVVTTPRGTATSAVYMNIFGRPTPRSFTPLWGQSGDVVTITGFNLQSVSEVWFGPLTGQKGSTTDPVRADVQVLSPTTITAVVPRGATTGPIWVGNTSVTPDFTVVAAPAAGSTPAAVTRAAPVPALRPPTVVTVNLVLIRTSADMAQGRGPTQMFPQFSVSEIVSALDAEYRRETEGVIGLRLGSVTELDDPGWDAALAAAVATHPKSCSFPWGERYPDLISSDAATVTVFVANPGGSGCGDASGGPDNASGTIVSIAGFRPLWSAYDRTLAHEIGHTLGLGHDNGGSYAQYPVSPNPMDLWNSPYGVKSGVYGDRSSTMGQARGRLRLNAVERDFLQVLPQSAIRTAEATSQTLELRALDSRDGVRLIYLPMVGVRKIALEYRPLNEFEPFNPVYEPWAKEYDGVLVRAVDFGRDGSSGLLDQPYDLPAYSPGTTLLPPTPDSWALTAGQSMVLPDRSVVRVDSTTPSTATVTITRPADVLPPTITRTAASSTVCPTARPCTLPATGGKVATPEVGLVRRDLADDRWVEAYGVRVDGKEAFRVQERSPDSAGWATATQVDDRERDLRPVRLTRGKRTLTYFVIDSSGNQSTFTEKVTVR